MCKECWDKKQELYKKVIAKIKSVAMMQKSLSEGSNPYIRKTDYEIQERANKKVMKEYFKSIEERFADRYEATTSGVSFLVRALSKLWWKFIKKNRELGMEEMLATVEGLIDPEEFREIVETQFGGNTVNFMSGELNYWMDKAGVNMIGATGVSQIVTDNLSVYYRTWSWTFADKINAGIKDVVIFWMQDGKSTADIAKEIQKRLKWFTKKRAEMISRTESTRVAGEVAHDKYNQIGVEYYEILPAATACPICVAKAADNPYPMSDKSAVGSQHPRCRCTIIPLLEPRHMKVNSERF